MARPLRIEFPGALYHITSRGNAQNKIYLNDADRHEFLHLVDQTHVWRSEPPMMVEEARFLISRLSTDRTGEVSLRLARLVSVCTGIPITDSELDRYQRQQTLATLALGGSNGDVLERTQHSESLSSACRNISQWISEDAQYALWEHAALLGHPQAQIELATQWLPPSYAEWTEEEQRQHQLAMGQLLHKARAECEFASFQAFAYPDGYGRASHWIYPDPEGHSPEIESYANLVASNLYLTERMGQAEPLRIFQQNELERREELMTPYEVNLARVYGRQVYQQSCE